MARRMLVWLKKIRHFIKDLFLLVLGIYSALWVENSVQDWQEQKYQLSYFERLSVDLETDIQQLLFIEKELKDKLSRLKAGIEVMQGKVLAERSLEAQHLAMELAGVINAYRFFTPQDFTYLSMRESGDFKLITSTTLKSKLIELNTRYKGLHQLQENYRQGLDDEFIPYWIRQVDVLANKALDPNMLHNAFFRNMVAFAWNETNQRIKFIEHIIKEAERVKLSIDAELIDK